jgi:hypothetical protein
MRGPEQRTGDAPPNSLAMRWYGGTWLLATPPGGQPPHVIGQSYLY